MLNHVSTNWGTKPVLPEGMSQMFRLLFLGNGWADCVEIWYALGDPLVTAYAVVTGGLSLYVRTCTPRFCISGTARPIAFKFGVWVWSNYLSALHKWGASARAHRHWRPQGGGGHRGHGPTFGS